MSKIRLTRAIGIAAVLLFTVSSYGDFQWFNTDTNRVAYNGGSQFLDYNRTNSAVGCFVQLIWAGSDNTIDLASNSGQGVTDDDRAHSWSWIGREVFGDGAGWMPQFETYSTDSNNYYYVRAWSAPASDYAQGYVPTSLTNYYGNSALWWNPGTEPGPDEFNFGGAGDVNSVGWHTDLQVPEPAMIGLGLVGLISLRFFRRRK